MKFRIRFADQIVGLFILAALASLVFVIVMLGRSQRWFAKDYSFTTSFSSAGGLSKNMAVQFRGFAIGNVKSFTLTAENEVEVSFFIYDQYLDRVKEGSLVELMVSPVGLGNQFLFHPGMGEVLKENAFIPAAGSAMAQDLILRGLASAPRHDDSISLLLNRISGIAAQLDDAFRGGARTTSIGRIVGNVEETLEGVKTLPGTVDRTVGNITGEVEDITLRVETALDALGPILGDIKALTAKVNEPDGLVYTVLDTEEAVYTNLVSSLKSISGILG
ncbi:MAG: MlaD family protein, partial [Treponema sp.]|nr:MlaD family protein [Treponema sp.]